MARTLDNDPGGRLRPGEESAGVASGGRGGTLSGWRPYWVQAQGGDLEGRRLSWREVEVLRLVARGLSNRGVPRELGVSEFTVKRHVQNLSPSSICPLALRRWGNRPTLVASMPYLMTFLFRLNPSSSSISMLSRSSNRYFF
ncbi:response regulator transcription factor [Sorangium sp. So ce375]|uniref:response regulator transcription factor n=1 Tax=Sorangium sp. So ce375 TaxID=3133306 RepID=UPI003F5C9CC9